MNPYLILKEQTIAFTGSIPERVTHVHYDSRHIGQDGCFVCIKGVQTDGHLFIDAAASQGAVQIIGDNKELLDSYATRYPYIQFILVYNAKQALAHYAAVLEDNPHHSLSLVGVTGTQGKTTITAYTRFLLNAAGIRTGSIGTAGVWDDSSMLPLPKSTPTTPESSDLYAYLRRMKDTGLSTVVMEATSIGLDQERLYGLHFDTAVHSNFSPEHLDYHKTMEHYRQSKLRLFDHAEKAVVNRDDDGMAEEILSSFEGELWTYGLHADVDISAHHIQVDERGSRLNLKVKDRTFAVALPIFGMHNIYNFLAAVGVCMTKGLAVEDILSSFSDLEGPPGRLQLIPELEDRIVLFDFAHTPKTLENLIETVSPLPSRRIIMMVSGIGIREKILRAPIATSVEGRADEIVVTADHPGEEEPEDVVADVLEGFHSTESVHAVPDRGLAVKKALSLSQPGDLVLLTGICMEDFRIVKGRKEPYYDYDHVMEYVNSSACCDDALSGRQK
ncbi:UDP-N-acetylmuramoyl-L-alanyl-D-glutamate--2,6-diaminopimelate ligase [Alkalicoccus chagannorensis]|uniref:UDP-N-acetylmuramoyl-L-alanyl-D-glutamate--2, 6-diaminopimelate ligase n=1 Tax=Alkalicoccus chagannorensis TaxID=427072 RepID=UPI000416AB4A|nr:UDP-N-acetylmuramoyl-L-alanyl-D-glutamate--2,6-diaminopimelate ligase [Alkalicoccus chagannorensis]